MTAGGQVYLVEPPPPLGEGDFTSPLYDPSTGGVQGGYTRRFMPLVVDQEKQAFLVSGRGRPAGYVLNTAPAVMDLNDSRGVLPIRSRGASFAVRARGPRT